MPPLVGRAEAWNMYSTGVPSASSTRSRVSMDPGIPMRSRTGVRYGIGAVLR